MKFLRTSFLLCLLGVAYCVPVSFEAVDMTHTFNNDTIHFPSHRKFELKITEKGVRRGFWLQLEEYSSSTDAGTHMDAPCLFAEGHWCIDQIPLDRLIAPAAVIDITSQAEANRDYGATIQDLQDWERKYHRSLDGMIVLLKSGWGKRWGDAYSFVGTVDDDMTKIHNPGFSSEAAQWIVDNRAVIAVGTEALTLDVGQNSPQEPAHRILYPTNIYGLESLANMDQLPEIGATLHAFPMKIGDAGAAPVRIVATVPRNK